MEIINIFVLQGQEILLISNDEFKSHRIKSCLQILFKISDVNISFIIIYKKTIEIFLTFNYLFKSIVDGKKY